MNFRSLITIVSYTSIPGNRLLRSQKKKRFYRVVARECTNACDIGGFRFEVGDMVATDTWSMHMDTDVWGADAAQFRPERFLILKLSLIFRDCQVAGAVVGPSPGRLPIVRRGSAHLPRHATGLLGGESRPAQVTVAIPN